MILVSYVVTNDFEQPEHTRHVELDCNGVPLRDRLTMSVSVQILFVHAELLFYTPSIICISIYFIPQVFLLSILGIYYNRTLSLFNRST